MLPYFLSTVESLSLDLKDPRWGKEFTNSTIARQYLYSVACNGGYGISVTSTKGNRGAPSTYFHCHRGCPRNTQSSKKITSTQKTGCTWKACLKFIPKTGVWILDPVKDQKTRRYIDHRAHNHEPFSSPNEYAVYRRLNSFALLFTEKLTWASVKPCHILSALDKNPGFDPTLKDIYNARQKFRTQDLNGRDSITALLDYLKLNKWTFNTQYDSSGKLLSLFFAHPNSIKLALRFPHVFGVDATYKTNNCELPCLHFVGSTSINKPFSAAFCLMNDETQPTYEWALEEFQQIFQGCQPEDSPKVFTTDSEQALISSINTVFPDSHHILCLWHINRNVETHLKTKASKIDQTEFLKLWNKLCLSDTQLDYQNSKDIIKNYLNEHNAPAFLDYLEKKWYPQAHKFVSVYTSKISHYGGATTSKTEGTHGVIKKDLETTRHDFYSTVMHFKNSLDIQYKEITARIAHEKNRKLNNFHPVFDSLHGKISQFAIKKANEQLQLISKSESLGECKHNFGTMWGIPCAHQIRTYLELIETPIPVDDFHKQWHLDLDYAPRNLDEVLARIKSHMKTIENEEFTFLLKFESDLQKLMSGRYALVPILPPSKKINNKGRPKGAKNKKLKRDLSEFEHVAKAEKKKNMKCGNCGEKGHDRRQCDIDESEDFTHDDESDFEEQEDSAEEINKNSYDSKYASNLDDSNNSDISSDQDDSSSKDSDISSDLPHIDLDISKDGDYSKDSERSGDIADSDDLEQSKDIHNSKDSDTPKGSVDLPDIDELNDLYRSQMVSTDNLEDEKFYHINHHQDPIKLQKYKDQLLDFVRPFITSIYDPPGDGHCGFHAIAHAIGKDGKDGMMFVRQSMVDDLDLHYDDYVKFYWQKSSSTKAKKSLTQKQIKEKQTVATESYIQSISEKIEPHSNEPVEQYHWFESTTMGPIAANAFSRPVVILGPTHHQCMTFLPFSSKNNLANSGPIGLGFVNGGHWVSLSFSTNSSSPFPNPSQWCDAHQSWLQMAGRNASSWIKDVYLKGCFDLWEKKMEERDGLRDGVTTRNSKRRKIEIHID